MVYQVQSKSDLEDKLKEAGNKLVVLDFYATWCGPCKLISPKIEDMSKQYSDVVFMKVDVDECEDVAMDYEVSCMPTFIFVKQGSKVAEFSGANEEKLRELVEANK